MAGVCLKNTDVKQLSEQSLDMISQQCKDLLPSYARPRFLRLQQEVDMTSTFKQRKVTLQKEGFDVGTVTEPMYYLNLKTDQYLPLDATICGTINKGEITMQY